MPDFKEEDWIEIVDESELPPEDEIVILGDSLTQTIGMGFIPKIKDGRTAVVTSSSKNMKYVTHFMRAPRPPMRRVGLA